MGLYRRPDSDIYWMSFAHKGKVYRKSTGTADEKLAKKILGKVQTQIVEGKWFDIDHSKQRTLEEMIERYKEEYTSQRTYYPGKRDHSIFKHLYAYFGKDCSLGEIEQMIGGYEQQRKKKDASPATVVKELGLLRTMFNIARKQWRWKIANPVSDIKLPRVRNERVRYLLDDEYKNLFKALDRAEEKWIRPFVIIALDTGLRLTNLCNLTWPEVDMFRKMITIDAEKMKNDDYIGIPLTPRAFMTLKELQKVKCISGHVFHNNGEKLYDMKVRRAFTKALRKAEITNFRFHDLRHTFASCLRQNGVDLHTISKLLGHKDMRMTQRYSHLNVDSLRTAISQLNFTFTSRSEKNGRVEYV